MRYLQLHTIRLNRLRFCRRSTPIRRQLNRATPVDDIRRKICTYLVDYLELFKADGSSLSIVVE